MTFGLNAFLKRGLLKFGRIGSVISERGYHYGDIDQMSLRLCSNFGDKWNFFPEIDCTGMATKSTSA
jgi:hypothetical protein